jgi:hypothetical protein
MKAGMAYEIQGKYKKALEQYKRIKTEYPRSFEATEIDKFISAMEGKVAE